MGKVLNTLISKCKISVKLSNEGWRVEGSGALGILAVVVVVMLIALYAPHVLPWFKG